MPALADSIPQSYSPAPLLKRRRHRSLKGRLHSDLLVRPVGLPLVRKSSCQVSGPSQPAGRRAVGRSGGRAGGRAFGLVTFPTFRAVWTVALQRLAVLE